MNHRLNNLDALRLLGALMVILGHAYVLLGRTAEVPFAFGYTVSTFGVVIFFSISGYLISASWTRSRSLTTYFAARCLRIFPALIVVVLVAMLAIGPVFTQLPTSDYFGSDQVLRYARNIILEPVYALPGVFTDNYFPHAVNGSLWTLPAEFACYLAVPILCVRSVRVRVPILVGVLALSLYLSRIPPIDSAVVHGTSITDASSMWVFFVAGALLRAGHEQLPGFFRTDVAVLAVLGQLALVSLRPEWVTDLTWVFMPYAILTAGLASTPVIRHAARFGDLSYGIYVWAFPVQQIVVETLGAQRMLINLALVTSITLVLAWLSWHVIESPAMKLKDRVGRRRSQEMSAAPA